MLPFCLSHIIIITTSFPQFPAAATTPNDKGKIPLHYAAREGRTEMVRFFLQVVPQTAAIWSDKQKLALHFAAGEGHLQIVRDLLTVHPRGAALQSAKGKLPLHFCARWGHLQIAHDLLTVYPEAIRALDWEGSLPLHDAAREGQCRMAKYLLEGFVPGLATANLRGDLPLFPAVRSANVDLVALLVQAWPASAKHILADVCADDNVQDWDIVELLLRGATDRLERDCELLRGREPPSVVLSSDFEIIEHGGGGSDKNKKAKKRRQRAGEPPRLVPAAATTFFATVDTATQQERGSPVIGHVCGKKRVAAAAAAPGEQKRKRCRCCRVKQQEDENRKMAPRRQFLPLHAALEAGASVHVLRLVLERRPQDRDELDESGRLPLHWAMTRCKGANDEVIDFVTKELITHDRACVRDKNQQLPLHIAIASQADIRVISALLEVYPTAGVETCRSSDRWRDKMPVDMALHFNNDLSTVYLLLRVDPSYATPYRLGR